MGEPLQRGVSLRLGKEAVVILLMTTNKWSLTDVQQMIGRGCRSMGKAHGYVFNLMRICLDKERALPMMLNDLRTRDLRTSFSVQQAVLLGGFMKLWTDKSLWGSN